MLGKGTRLDLALLIVRRLKVVSGVSRVTAELGDAVVKLAFEHAKQILD